LVTLERISGAINEIGLAVYRKGWQRDGGVTDEIRLNIRQRYASVEAFRYLEARIDLGTLGRISH
jgi:hypothetical protein